MDVPQSSDELLLVHLDVGPAAVHLPSTNLLHLNCITLAKMRKRVYPTLKLNCIFVFHLKMLVQQRLMQVLNKLY